MTLSVLITQCLQRDFIDPLGPHEPLPNKLHVGHAEALRLVGSDPATGPISQLMHWARAQPADSLEILHIRDWHDPANPRQRDHLATFGHHCVQGTPGADLVLGMGERRANEHLVDAIALNDFEDTSLAAHLERLAKRANGDLRVGVVGVWTEAKVSFLLYDLKTRAQIDRLATCSALTASASRAQHFNALEQLRRLLGVEVHDSIGDFTDWLVPGGRPVSLPAPAVGNRPKVTGSANLADADHDLLALLYRGASEITLNPLSGGFSGALVFGVESKDSLGHREAPSVAKLGPRKLIASERTAFEKVEAVLGNDAPAVRGFVDLGERAGLKYSYAAMGHGRVRTFKALYESGLSRDRVDQVLTTVFDEILGRFTSVAQLEPLPLLAHYGFHAGLAARVRELVGTIAPDATDTVRIGDVTAMHPARLYEEVLPNHKESAAEQHYVSYVHGDLNGANILVDARENVWLIDFFHTARGHVLKDLAKLENDLLYLFTPLENEADLAQALTLSKALRAVADLREPLPESLPGLTNPALQRAWAAVRTLRSFTAKLVAKDRDPQQLRIALLRYAVHTMSFDEASPQQKRWALAASAMWAEDVARTLKSSTRLRVDWLAATDLRAKGRLGLTILPGRRDRGRVLADDLAALREDGATQVVSLITRAELAWADVPELPEKTRESGLGHRLLEIPDQDVPTLAEARGLVAEVNAALDAGASVVFHCLGGLGRSGTLAACVLVSRGFAASDAIRAVRSARSPRAIETRGQERFVEAFTPA